MTKRKPFFDKTTKIILIGILVLAAIFRFYNINWDQGGLYHPDERNIANAVSQISLFSQMDPKFYAYGGFVIYLYKFTADALSFILNNPMVPHDWGWINVIGRSYSAFFSMLTIIPLFLLGKKLFNQKVAYLACLFYAVTVSSIQTAHFATTESILTLLLLLITYVSLLMYEHPSRKYSLLLGALLGIAIATKTTGMSFALIPAVTLLLLFIKNKLPLRTAFTSGAFLGMSTLLIFTLFSPFTFLNSEKFLESMRYENGVVLGTNPVVYTYQFIGTTPYLFQIKNLFWQIGPVLLVVILGLFLTAKQELTKRRILFLIFISFPIFYFFYVGSWHAKFNRYMVPLLPFLLLFGSNFLSWLISKYKRVGYVVTFIFIVTTFLYAVSFMSIYQKEQTRTTASKWIYQYVPSGSFILSEHWDEGLPVPLPEGSPQAYQLHSLTIYEPDNHAKLEYYANYLSQADYITINSRRLYGTLMHLPEKYPLTKRYYELLFAEKLGYEKVAEFSSYPSFLGITLNDDQSEETFQVYDHPKSFVFKNTNRFSYQEIKELLTNN